MHQPVTSSTAADASASVPTRDSSSPYSLRIRASTGNAVTLIAAPTNRLNATKGAPSPANRGYKATASSEASANGTTMLTSHQSTAARPRALHRRVATDHHTSRL